MILLCMLADPTFKPENMMPHHKPMQDDGGAPKRLPMN